MTTNPANSNLSPATGSAAAVGGPLPPMRLLLANGNGHGWRASLGFLLHTAVIAALFLFPLLMTEQINGGPLWREYIKVPIQKGDPQGSGLKQKSSGPKQPVADQGKQPQLTLSNLPIKPEGHGPINTAGFNGELDRIGIPDGAGVGVPATSPSQNFQQPFAPAPVAQAPVPIFPGGKVRPPKLLRRVEPVYPFLAKQAGIQGTVVLEATLGTDGRVEHIGVLGGHPLLVESAQQAVAQWLYEPTYLNDRPVPVLLRVKVEFILRR
ncbi:MAG: energy transducer TonB [Candidatus Acidiferrales bacterium]